MDSILLRRRVAANIKRCRRERGYSQEALAQRMGVSLRYVSMLEQNARNLSITSLARIAAVLEVDVADLVCDRTHLDQAKRSAAELGIELLRQHLISQHAVD